MERGGALGGACAGPDGAGRGRSGGGGPARAPGAGLSCAGGRRRVASGLGRLPCLQAVRDLITVSNLLGWALRKGLPVLKTTTGYGVAHLKMV